MMAARILILLAAIVFQNGVFCTQEKLSKLMSRSRRSLTSNIEIYTLDHFIALVEKIERHKLTQEKPMKVIANYIRKLGYDSEKWTSLLGSQTDSLPDGILTAQEKSVLTKMIKHQFVGQQEEGVVNTPFGDVAIGRVITGICAGISRNKAVVLQQLYQITSKHLDNLYAATIAGDVGLTALANKVNPSTPLFGPGGTWSPNTQCPLTFNADNQTPSKATNAQILGGIDGFLMGYKLPSLYQFRLGQLLRMYYNKDIVDHKHFAACKRLTTFKEHVVASELTDQVTLSAYAEKAAWNKDIDLSKVKNSDIPQLGKSTTQKFYSYIKNNLPHGKGCPVESKQGCLLPANIVFVLDESGSITSQNYEVEKDFVNKIIDAFDISSYQTRVAIVEYDDEPHKTIKLDDFDSKSVLKCAVNNLHYGGGGTATSEALKAAYEILRTARSNATPKNKKDPPIMVLLTDGESNGGEAVLKPIVESIKKNMTDLTILTVGIGNYKQSELELIATDKINHVFTTTDFSRLVNLVKTLRKQTCEVKTKLSFEGQDVGQQKKEVKVTGILNPDNPRFFVLPSGTLKKMENISIEIKPSYGTVTLYGSRTNPSPGPDNYDFKFEYRVDGNRKRRSIDADDGKTLKFWNVCKGYNSTNCPPIYLSIYGMNSTNSCTDRDCSLPNQIKFELKAGQITKKQETTCYLKVPAEKFIKAANISIKVQPVNDSITVYYSRTYRKPDNENNDFKFTVKVNTREKMVVIHKPCKGYNETSQCPPLYVSFRGSHITCQNCTADGICDYPNYPKQIAITIIDAPRAVRPKVQTKTCFHRLTAETLWELKSVQIKVSALNDTVEMFASRINYKPGKSNFTGKLDAVDIGNSSMLKIDDPCKGYDKNNCPPLYLSFKGKKLSCNCTTAAEKNCTLPQDVAIKFTKGDPSSKAGPMKISVLLALVSVLLAVFMN